MPWKQQLEASVGLPVKTHKTAENCMRLLRKKQHSVTRPPCVFVVSWTNAQALVSFISESSPIPAKVIILIDREVRFRDAAEQLKSKYAFITRLAASWSEAIEAATCAASELSEIHLQHN